MQLNLMPPDIVLERYLLGELPSSKMKEIRSLSEKYPQLLQRLVELKSLNQKFFNSHAFVDLKSKLSETENPSTSIHSSESQDARKINFFRFSIAAPLLATLTLVTVLLTEINLRPQDESSENKVTLKPVSTPRGTDGIRLKGSPAGLIIYRKENSGIKLLLPGSSAAVGDTLQLFYHNKSAQYGMIFSVDGNASVTLHFPEAMSSAAHLDTGSQIGLPHSFRLDNAPQFEQFILVTSQRPFSSDSLIHFIRKKVSESGQFKADFMEADLGFNQYPYTILKQKLSPITGSKKSKP